MAPSATRRRPRRGLVLSAAAVVLIAGLFVGRAALTDRPDGLMNLSRSGFALGTDDAPVPASAPTRDPGDSGDLRSGDVLSQVSHDGPFTPYELEQQGGRWEASSGDETATASETGSSATNPDTSITLTNVIKTAAIDVVVGTDTFQDSLQQANAIAASQGGYVQASSTSGTRSGTLTIRVPAEHFEATLGELQALGRVESERANGEDVSAEFVDLGARLKIAEQRVTVLSRLMQRTNGVNDILRLRNVLEEAQLEVEEIKGQLRLLRDQSSLGTIALLLREEGVANGSAPGLGGALSRAWSGLTKVIYTAIVALGYLLPVLLVAGLAWWIIRRRRHTSSQL